MLKILKQTLSLVWSLYRVFTLVTAAWEFLRDHFDGF